MKNCRSLFRPYVFAVFAAVVLSASPTAAEEFETETEGLTFEEREGYSIKWFQRAVDMTADGDLKGAVRAYGHSIEMHPAYADAYYNRGVVFKKLELFDDAVWDFSKAIELDDGHAEAYINRGFVVMKGGDAEAASAAIGDFTRAAEIDPGSGRAFYNRGVAFWKTGERGESVADFERACSVGYDPGCRMYERYSAK